MIWYSCLFKNIPQVGDPYKGFNVVNKAEVDVFFWHSLAFSDSVVVGNLISGFSAFSKSSLYIWKFLVQVLLKPSLKPSFWALPCYHVKWVQLCGSLTILLHFLLWDWNENGLFAVLWPLLSFPDSLTIECSTLAAASFRICNSSAGIPSPPLTLGMLPKAHLTSHSRMSGSRWVITPFWLSGSLRYSLYSSVYSCYLFLISSDSLRSILFLSFIVPIFAWHVPLVSLIFLQRSLVFPILLFSSVSFTEEGFLISPCYSLELCIQMSISFLSSFVFCFP